MTRFRASEPQVTKELLGNLAEEAVRDTLAMGARIRAAIERRDDVRHGLASAAEELGAAISREMIELALSNAGDAPPTELGNKLAFQILTARPSSPVARLLTGVAERAFRRAGPAVSPLLEQGDLVSLLRWKLWTLPADYFTPDRILKHPGLAAYLSVIARRIVIDECRAMGNRTRTGIEPESIESAVDPRATLDSVLDELDLLQRFAGELSGWQAPLVQVLAGQLDREQALVAINHKREAAGLQAWSADAMRTAIHRARKRLRELMTRSPTLQAQEPLRAGTDLASRRVHMVTHAWRRFWSARDGSYSLGDNGFLVDPEAEYGRHVHDAVALDQLAALPCLILLGEPGIGKSTAIDQERERLQSARQHVFVIDLARTSSGEALRARMQHVRSPDGESFHLFLDGLDEGLARNPGLASELGALLLDLVDSSNARVRIASRTLEWPVALEDQLQRRWNSLRVYELLPLRRVDVILAAHDFGVDGALFVENVRERDAISLAIRPISLRFLLEMYTADGTLPHSKARLYDEGTVILCSEEAALQRGRGRRNADTFRRRAIAARIAALSTFTNRHLIARSGHGDNDVLLVDAVVGGTEALADATYRIDLPAVEDALAGTALFTSRTATTYGWSHQSYREFLAAWYLAQHRVDADVATTLYFPRGAVRVPGPLREVAAWHATFVPALFDLLVERDPEALLHSDSGAASAESRAQLVRALLDRMARFEALDGRYQRREYCKLDHPALAEQLRPYITDRNANIIVRRAAMEIASSCRVTGVVDDLVTVLFDRSGDPLAREVAANALGQLGGDRVRSVFLALLAAGFDPDPNDGIRGSVLDFLWPEHIDARTLFRHLTIPKRDDLLGTYQRFIYELPGTLRPDDLATALQWVEALGDQANYDLQHTQHDIIDIALPFLDRPDVRAPICRIIRASLRTHLGAWYAQGSSRHGTQRSLSPSDRRLILEELIRIACDDEELGPGMVYFDPPLLGPEDVRWLAEHARATPDAAIARACGRCVAALYARYGYPEDAASADAVISVESVAFREPLQPFLDTTVELGSEHAKQLADSWSRVRRAPKIVETNAEPSSPSAWSRSLPYLERAEAGDLARWIGFVATWTWTKYGAGALSEVPEWSTLDPANQDRVLLAGLRFVNECEAPDPAWLDERDGYPWSAVAARAALQLVSVSRPQLLDSISEWVWRRWCPVLVGVPFPDIEPAVRAELFRRCAHFDELTDSIVRVVRRENHNNGHVFVFANLPDPLPEALHPVVLGLLTPLGDEAFEEGLALLVRAGNPAACELARTMLQDGVAGRAARSARVILPHDPAQWRVAISRMQRDREFIEALAPLVSFDEDLQENPFTTLTEHDAAEVCLALIRQFSIDEDSRRPQGELVLSDHIERLYRRVIGMLVNGGTAESVAALEWLVAQEPEREMLRYLLVQAREKHADASWRPFSIDEFWNTVRGAMIKGAPSRGLVRCMLSVKPTSDLQQLVERINDAVQGGSVEHSAEGLFADVPLDRIPAVLHAVENTPTLRDAVLAMRAGDEWIFEAIPSITPAMPARRDADRAEIAQLLESVHVLVETATETETAALHAAMTPLAAENALVVGSLGIPTYTIGLLGRYPVAHLQTDMGAEGPNAAQLATQDAIREVEPKLVLLVGIAFGLDRTKQRLGDVLAAQHVTSYEMVKLKPETIDWRGETLRGNVIMTERIKTHARSWRALRADGSQVAVQVGQILSGAKLVNNREFRDWLARLFPAALGGEMEGIGAYAAAFRTNIPVMLVKAICDWADGLKNDRAQPFAAAAAVDLVRHVLDKPDVLNALSVPAATPLQKR